MRIPEIGHFFDVFLETTDIFPETTDVLRKLYILMDVSVLKISFCAEFFAASSADRARHTTLTLFYGRDFSKNTILYLPPWFSVQQFISSFTTAPRHPRETILR